MKNGPTPELYSYLSYRDFLRDWFKARKSADPRYSHRLFARRAGVRSPSLLKEVINNGRNLTPSTSEGFIRALGLNNEAATFFTDLVQFDQAKTPGDKNDAWDRIAACRRFRSARPIEGGTVAYLSHWYYPAIRELSLRADFQPDSTWIARQLQPNITEPQARRALETLLELGLLVRDGERVKPAEVSLATPHQVAGLAAHNYHHQMLDRARDAIEGALPDERHMLGVTVAIPEHLIPQLKAELDAFQERLLHICDEHASDAQRVFQLNLHLVPLSRSIEPRQTSDPETS